MESHKGAWGKSPQEVEKSVLEHVSTMAEGFDGQRMTEELDADGNVKFESFKMEGFPEVLEAAKEQTLRILIGTDSRGVREAACVVVQSSSLPMRRQRQRQLAASLVLVLGVLACWLLWQYLPASCSRPIRIAIVLWVLMMTSAFAAINAGTIFRRKQ
jgi:hypothetical protein